VLQQLVQNFLWRASSRQLVDILLRAWHFIDISKRNWLLSRR
jgi:hypothetical protein